jgi:hypothetical protein
MLNQFFFDRCKVKTARILSLADETAYFSLIMGYLTSPFHLWVWEHTAAIRLMLMRIQVKYTGLYFGAEFNNVLE